jgi:hypothetical protein
LHNFNIHAKIASRKESFDFPGGRLWRYINKKLNDLLPFERRWYMTEASIFCFDPRFRILKPHGDLYMDGLWQSVKYFEDIEDILRRDLKIASPHEPQTLQESEKIRSVQHPVCIGIRRYQEVSVAGAHVVLPIDYYLNAVDKIASAINKPHFFIFCNDREWIEEHFHIHHPYTVITSKPENERAYEDLWLMSLCHNFIISNSSYYWWGAWLSEHADKLVIAPDKGFYNRDIIPDEWSTIRVSI